MSKRGRKGTSVIVQGHYVYRHGKRVHIQTHTRKKPKRRKTRR